VTVVELEQHRRQSGSATPRSSKQDRDDTVQRVVKLMDEACHDHHDQFVNDAKRRYRMYRGWVDEAEDKPDWQTKLYPKYGLQLVETIVSNLIDDRIDYSIDPYPMVGSTDTRMLQQRIRGGKILEQLIRIDQDLEHFDELQRPWVLQGAITGLTITKQYWHYREANVPRTVRTDRTVHDERGNVIGVIPKFVENTAKEIVDDRSCVEVVNARDFFWPESAVSLDRAPWVIHRVYVTFDELLDLEAKGVYERVDDLKGTMAPKDDDPFDDVLFDMMRSKGMVELLEMWSGDEVITVGNRQVLMRHGQNPFRHGEKPFVVTSSMPDLFKIPGISDMELIDDIQKMIWQLSNQQLDNVTLLANAIVLIASDVEDPDDYVFAPLERWIVDNPDQVKLLEMNPLPAEIATQTIERLMGDMQNVTGGMPFMAGAQSSQLDQKTATGVSIVTTLAQRRLAAKKQNFTWALGRIVNQRIQLMQQFFRQETLLPRIGSDGVSIWEEVFPDEIQGRFIVRTRPTTESLLRQERRAEAQALMQIFAQAAAAYAAMGTPLNGRAFMEYLLDAFDVTDPDYFFSAQPQPSMAGQQPGGAQPATPAGPNMGTTAATAVDAASPSATGGVSLSPAGASQQFGAAGGGAQGVPVTS
jgi:hypothetical protein